MADTSPELLPCPFCGGSVDEDHAPDCWFKLREAGQSKSRMAEAWNRRATPPSPSTAPMCERKTAKLEEEGYAKTGYVLRQPGKDREVVVSDGGAVSWFTTEQWNWLMFNRDHVEFQWPKPVAALASRPAEVDDELKAFASDLTKSQASLDPDAARILRENAWDLYSVDDEGLPPLPLEAAHAAKGQVAFFVKWSEIGKPLRGELLLYTAEQYRQGQRDAVAADRARRQEGES